MEHPDRIFGLVNVDQEEQSNLQDTHRESIKESELPPMKKEEEEEKQEEAEGENENEEEEEEFDDDGNPIPKKKPEPVVVKKDKSNRISSDKDQMIEIKWNQTAIQESSTILCFANYREAFVNIVCIDIKSQRKQNLKTLNLNASPTKIFQINENNMLFGTEGGKIEHWQIYDDAGCQKIHDAHPESPAGISAILEIQSKSPLLRGEPSKDAAEDSFKLIATASQGSEIFRLWHLINATCELIPYLKIETTIKGGIKFLLESHKTQIVAANENTIKFYDFIDKVQKQKEEDTQKKTEETNKIMKDTFRELIDEEVGMKLDRSMLLKYFANLVQKVPTSGVIAAADVSDECYDDVWYEMDFNQTGYITWHQIKAFIARVEVHEEELRVERERLEKLRQEREAELKRIAEEKAAREAAEEAARLEAEAAEAEED